MLSGATALGHGLDGVKIVMRSGGGSSEQKV